MKSLAESLFDKDLVEKDLNFRELFSLIETEYKKDPWPSLEEWNSAVEKIESKLKKYDSKKWTRPEIMDILSESKNNCLIGITKSKLYQLDDKKPAKSIFIFKYGRSGYDIYKHGYYRNPDKKEGLYISNLYLNHREVGQLIKSNELVLFKLSEDELKYWDDFRKWFNEKYRII